jgi:hypothetical protein
MQQTVMVFASSAARTSALSGVLAEGMVSYLQDTNTLEVYDGSAWVGATGDITGLTAGTGISISSATGPVPTVTNSMATEITAKGDLIVGTGSATFDNLAAGSNGETLVADSSTSTGLRYQGAMAAGRNFIINGGMDIWQRGTSIAAQQVGFNYTADRWGGSCNTSGAATVSRQVTGDTTNLPFVQYCARYQRTAGNTATGIQYLNQPIETINSIPLVGKTVTVSFYARAGANFSAASNILTATLISGTGTDQNYLGTWTGGATVASTNATLTTTWQRFQFTGTIGATATELTLPFTYTPTGTAGANDYYEVTGVQLEVGSVATQFSRAGATIQGELAACQRYFQIIAEGNSAYIFNGNNWYAFDVRGVYTFPVQMRTAPTLVGTTGTNYYRVQYNTTTDDLNEIKMASATVRNCLLLNDTQAAVTAGTPATVLTNNASASVAISAEL